MQASHSERGNFVENLALLDEKLKKKQKKSAYVREDWCFISLFVFLGTP